MPGIGLPDIVLDMFNKPASAPLGVGRLSLSGTNTQHTVKGTEL